MSLRILSIRGAEDLAGIFRELAVDPYGIKIMVPKAIGRCVRIDGISCIAANILKQEMLSLGGDAALPRNVLTGKLKATDCVLIGSLAQYARLGVKLQKQPFGLAKLGQELTACLENYSAGDFVLDLNRYTLRLGRTPRIMGIMNLTPDSFSGDGLYTRRSDPVFLVEYARAMVRNGADIIDIGGESTRPGSRRISAREEIQRVIPAITAISRNLKVPVSIDTYKPEVATAALDQGACIVNDISGMRKPAMARIIGRHKAGVVIMHMQKTPATMQKEPVYKCVTADILAYLRTRVAAARDAGIAGNRIMVDPGIGFGKTVAHNLTLLRDLDEFRVLGLPIMVGTSRKNFIGKITGAETDERIAGTIASCVLAVKHGAHIVRVHDVKQVKQALAVTRAILYD